uniref:Uncharacterized protein n=1 Tax=Pyrodinium bahamense TaxID=73915 RepID=A0A7S0F921_9DINO|mmetsp:Transcript_12884/g.35677  ORF Transcript_12884/g.35677 Transcript_12884/m.35677 type:complete len:205 (+) Transcript_12884:42-656(+)
MQCPAGHRLDREAVRAGVCDGCGRAVSDGERAMNCTSCNWYLCTTCRPPQCPSGHKLRLTSASDGTCDGCKRRVWKGDPVMDCPQCDWWLCAVCHPPARITECPVGHALQPSSSQMSRRCGGCEQMIPRGGRSMDCLRCAWYLCDSCHKQEKPEYPSLLFSTVNPFITVSPHDPKGQPLGQEASADDGVRWLSKSLQFCLTGYW